jgi:hypothetical protein
MPRQLEIVIPVGGTEWVIGEDDDSSSYLSLCEALEGDTRRLHQRLNAGTPLSRNERDFLAGKIKRPRHRPPKRTTRTRTFKIACVVYYCRRLGWKFECAVDEAMRAFSIHPRNRREVTDAVKAVKKEPGWQMLLEASMSTDDVSEKGLEALIKGLNCRGLGAVTRSPVIE